MPREPLGVDTSPESPGWASPRSTVVSDAALEAGITFLDTADVYGSGQTEEFLGEALNGR